MENEPEGLYKVAIWTVGDLTPSYNALRFKTREAAQSYGEDLASRWMAIVKWEVEEVVA